MKLAMGWRSIAWMVGGASDKSTFAKDRCFTRRQEPLFAKKPSLTISFKLPDPLVMRKEQEIFLSKLGWLHSGIYLILCL